MTGSFEQFLTASQTLRLTDRERAESFKRVLAHMEDHPIAAQSAGDQSAFVPGIFSREAWASLFSSIRLMPALALALLLLIGSGVTSVAAEGALPGDTLYPVKIHINESVRKAFAGSAEADARLEAKLVERRLAEARELTARGGMSAEVQQTIATAIAKQVSAAREKVAALSMGADLDAATDVSTELEAAVKAHQNVFTRLSQSNGPSVDLILSALATADTGSAQAQADLHAKVTAASSGALHAFAERGIAAAQLQTDIMRAMLDHKRSELTVHARGEVEARLKAAQEAIAQAQARLAAGDSGQAVSIAAQANTAAHEGNALGTMQNLLLEVTADDGDTNVEINTNDNDPTVKVQSSGNTRVRINGKDVSSSAGAAVSAVSSQNASRVSNTQTSITVNQQTTSQGTNSTTHVNTSTSVNVEGGGSVHVEQNAGATVNNSVHISQ